MTKPVIVTRAGKGDTLSWEEADANFSNLQNATIGVTDGTTSGTLDLNDTLTFTAGSNVTLTYNATTKALSIASSSSITSSDVTTALGYTPQNSADKGQANGYASLDSAGLVPSTQLPSYVDDVLEYADLATFPTTGETGKIYVAIDTGKTYRWSGSAYVEISASPGSTDSVTEGSTNLYFTTQRARDSFSGGTNITITNGVISSSGGLTDIVQDTTPQLGGALDVNGQSIVSTSNGNIVLEPNGTGDIFLNADTVRVGDLNTEVFVTTNGLGALTLNTNSGTNSGFIEIQPSTNNNIRIQPNGTGGTVIKNLEYQEFVHSLGTTSGTIAPNATNGNIQTITLNGNLTINAFTSPVSGQTITLIINTGGTGRTLTSTMLFAGGSKTLSTTNTTDILTISYIGTTYYASLVKGYA
jgi:hypothetical protein